MDMITFAMAKAYTDKKLGYLEDTVLTYDGNTEGKETFVYEGMPFVKVSDAVYDVAAVQSVLMEDGLGGYEISKYGLSSGTLYGVDVLIAAQFDNLPLVVFAPAGNSIGVSVGTWVFAGVYEILPHFVREVRIQTIHQIDENGIPDAWKTVDVDLGVLSNIMQEQAGKGDLTKEIVDESLLDFWRAVSTDREVHFVMRYTADNGNFNVRITGVTKYFRDGVCDAVQFMYDKYNLQGGAYSVTISRGEKDSAWVKMTTL